MNSPPHFPVKKTSTGLEYPVSWIIYNQYWRGELSRRMDTCPNSPQSCSVQPWDSIPVLVPLPGPLWAMSDTGVPPWSGFKSFTALLPMLHILWHLPGLTPEQFLLPFTHLASGYPWDGWGLHHSYPTQLPASIPRGIPSCLLTIIVQRKCSNPWFN